MEPSIGKQLGWAVLGWVLYFLIVFIVCNTIYLRLRGQPPRNPDAPVLVRGKTTSAMTVWQARDRRLRRWLIGIGIAFMLLPLALPAALKRLLPSLAMP